MMNVPELITTNRRQYQVYLVLSLVVLGFVSILHGIDRTVFQRFLGGINPLLAFLVAIVLGLFFLSYFLFEGWFAVYERGNGRGLAYAAGIAAVLGLIMIFVDTKIVFPHTINILFPKSLLFYPARYEVHGGSGSVGTGRIAGHIDFIGSNISDQLECILKLLICLGGKSCNNIGPQTELGEFPFEG